MKMKRVELRGGGMFSNVNEVVQRLHLAEQGDFGFIIRWERSLYSDPAKKGDPWSYFFDPCFPSDNINGENLELWGDAGKIISGTDNIITPRAGWRDGRMLRLPTHRHLPARLIERHLTLKPNIQNVIDQFAAGHFSHPIIGLHIRGKGRNHGGAAELRAQLELEDGVPYTQYFQPVRAELETKPNARIIFML